MIAQSRRIQVIVAIVAVILLIPLVASQLSDEVNWGVFDFIIAGVLLLGTGLLIDRVIMKVQKSQQRILIIIAIVLGFLLIWAELAVGIFGTPFAGS